MTTILRCTTQLVDEIRRDLSRPHPFAAERVGFLSVRPAATRRSLVLIVEAYHPVADADYLNDRSVGAMMGANAIRKALDIALLENVGMFHIHMHEHAGRPSFSRTDLLEQDKFVPDFFKVCPTMPHGAVVLSHNLAAARAWITPNNVEPINELNLMGAPSTIHVFSPKVPPSTSDTDFTRQSFLGPRSGLLFANIRALVVGVGGVARLFANSLRTSASAISGSLTPRRSSRAISIDWSGLPPSTLSIKCRRWKSRSGTFAIFGRGLR